MIIVFNKETLKAKCMRLLISTILAMGKVEKIRWTISWALGCCTEHSSSAWKKEEFTVRFPSQYPSWAWRKECTDAEEQTTHVFCVFAKAGTRVLPAPRQVICSFLPLHRQKLGISISHPHCSFNYTTHLTQYLQQGRWIRNSTGFGGALVC